MKKKSYPIEPDDYDTAKFSEHISLDRMGSYTGIPVNPWELPVQDADDL